MPEDGLPRSSTASTVAVASDSSGLTSRRKLCCLTLLPGVKRSRSAPVFRARRHVVHGREEPVGSANVGKDLDVEFAGQNQPPISATGARLARQPFLGIAVLQIPGVEMGRLQRTQGERDFGSLCAGRSGPQFLNNALR